MNHANSANVLSRICSLQGARFTCHDGNTIPASFVDDGICDCCDGADERPPTPRCRNRCAAQVDKELEYI